MGNDLIESVDGLLPYVLVHADAKILVHGAGSIRKTKFLHELVPKILELARTSSMILKDMLLGALMEL